VPGQSLAKVFGKLLVDHKVAEAKRTIERLTNDRASYSISEAEFNTLGYDFMGSNQLPEALATFKTNTQLFPKSGNTYDSYGEALEKDGQKEEAIKMYRKSLALDATNDNSRKALEKLLKQ
jgi:tetratricopeptide (TPR) repeat protein